MVCSSREILFGIVINILYRRQNNIHAINCWNFLLFPVKGEQRDENLISFSFLNTGIAAYGLKRMEIVERINLFTDFSDNLFNID